MLLSTGAGYNLIRTGGTYVEADSDEVPTDPEDQGRNGFLWKKQRGPPWLRPGGNVENHDGMNGVMTTRGWSMFEAIAMCEAMAITPVITLKSTETLEDLGDLVEYLYGSHASEWGRMRAADGHPAPYNISWFEIGNEIDTQDFAGRAMAMEARAHSIGKGGILRYACPANCGDDAVINASFAGTPALGERVYVDVHDGGRGSLEAARSHVRYDRHFPLHQSIPHAKMTRRCGIRSASSQRRARKQESLCGKPTQLDTTFRVLWPRLRI
jgi:hypothetical protein